jgi:hypothetical protein
MQMRIAAGLAALVAIAGCSSERAAPTEFQTTVPLYSQGGNAGINMGTHLRGGEEVLATIPNTSSSNAQGQATFRISGTIVEFRLVASNINNVVMSHIHCGVPGTTGPIGQWLFPSTAGGPPLTPPGIVEQNGVLASGTFDAAGVHCPVAEGNPASGLLLLDAMRNGWTYVNVHTNDGIDPANTGPGDFPGGEIRGQLAPTGGN